MIVQILISIVVYNTDRLTLERLIASVISQIKDSKFNLQSILVDHSSDQRYENLVKNLPNWFYLSQKNQGYGCGNNSGISKFSNFDFVAILNPDLILEPSTILSLLERMKLDTLKSIGLITPKICYPDGKWQNLNKTYPTLTGLLGRRFNILRKIKFVNEQVLYYEMSKENEDAETDIESPSGCFFFLRSLVWEKVGGFDPKFFLYFEDFDLGRRVQRAGYRTIYYPKAKAIHEYQRGTQSSLTHILLFFRSMVRYFWKWGFKLRVKNLN